MLDLIQLHDQRRSAQTHSQEVSASVWPSREH
jgi:hypothetical protein